MSLNVFKQQFNIWNLKILKKILIHFCFGQHALVGFQYCHTLEGISFLSLFFEHNPKQYAWNVIKRVFPLTMPRKYATAVTRLYMTSDILLRLILSSAPAWTLPFTTYHPPVKAAVNVWLLLTFCIVIGSGFDHSNCKHCMHFIGDALSVVWIPRITDTKFV